MGYWKYSWLFQPVFQEERESQGTIKIVLGAAQLIDT